MQPPGRYTATMVDQPELQFESEPPLRDPHLVIAWAGWNDAGESASTAARYLAATLSAEPFASIDPEEFYDFTEARPLARLPARRPGDHLAQHRLLRRAAARP